MYFASYYAATEKIITIVLANHDYQKRKSETERGPAAK